MASLDATTKPQPTGLTRDAVRDEAASEAVPVLLVLLVALPAALLATLQIGRLHPDEVFQFLEPGQRLAFGTGFVAWEWKVGLRNWIIPGILGGFLRVCKTLGIDDPQARRAVLELPQYGLHAASLAAVYRLISRRSGPIAGARPRLLDAGACGVLLVGLYAPVLHFAGRTLGESISTSFMVWGLERADVRDARPRTYGLAGALLGCAVVARYGSAVIAGAAIAWLLLQRRFRAAGYVAAGGAAIALVLGVVDWQTWGRPFHSLLKYVDFNILSGAGPDRFGSSPWSFYLPWLLVAPSAWFWPAIAIAAAHRWKAERRPDSPSGLLLFCAAVYLLTICATPHKEQRFLYPALILATVAAAPVWLALLRRLPPFAAGIGVLASLAAGLVLLTFDTRFVPKNSADFLLVIRASREGRGVVQCPTSTSSATGQFYAGDTPWIQCKRPRRLKSLAAIIRDSRYDRVVLPDKDGQRVLSPHGFVRLGGSKGASLWARP
jgi:GPI mannosyltransferase 3